ncbi:arylamine N-acetyltransferase family protein [Rhodopila sp.]|uniref:arylamine N-acetyltransferase family protein n=1 Tax=Rhodopila sp. TaxID=2480087 RepID=UPI003D0D174B
MTLDLTAYFARIGYQGPSEPTLDVLVDLHALQLAQITFEGLDPLLGRAVAIDSDSIQAKLVNHRRGGYCHEQNRLFQDVLANIGFAVTALGARTMWMRPSLNAPQTHRRTLVTVAGQQYIADVGFGPQSPPAPLLLAHGMEQATSHGTYRIRQDRQHHEVQLRSPEGWRPMYAFTLNVPTDADFEMANWFMSTHPRTLFVRNLIVSRIVGERRISLMNKSLTVRYPDGRQDEHRLADANALGDVLENTMELALPVSPSTIWARLPREVVPAWP